MMHKTSKEILQTQTYDVLGLLYEYMYLHNDRLEKTATLISFLKELFLRKKINFEEIYDNSAKLFDKLQDKNDELLDVKKNHYKNFNTEEMLYFDCMIKYIQSLKICVYKLNVLNEALYFKSLGSSEHILTWTEYNNLEKAYQDSVELHKSITDEFGVLHGHFMSSVVADVNRT